MSDRSLISYAPMEGDIARKNWQILQTFNYLRLAIAVALTLFFFLQINIHDHMISYEFYWNISTKICQLYFALILVTMFLAKWYQVNFEAQVFFIIMLDISIFTTLIYYNNIIVISLVVLICAIIASGCIISRNKNSLFFAAFASLTIIAAYLMRIIIIFPDIQGLLVAGIASCCYFFTAILIYNVSRTTLLTKELARQQADDILALKNLNAQVIQHLRVGVLVLNKDRNVYIINPIAEKFLGISAKQSPVKLDEKFMQKIADYQNNTDSNLIELTWNNKKLLLHCINLGKLEKQKLLIFIEDADLTQQKAQQLKLASMGKFTAGIAHEIRNPLSSINQAAELLSQDVTDFYEQKKLTTIICNNVKRIDEIIKTVLQLSRRKKETISIFEITDFLKAFIAELNKHLPIIEFKTNIKHIQVQFEPQQLRQVLINLWENAQRYNNPHKKITFSLKKIDDEVNLDIIDYGSGIPEKDLYNIFEPFYTTEAKGTGLGLYMCKELCQANHAEITAFNHEAGGACFRITFGKFL